LVEFFPHDDDRKGEQHRVEHTNCGKLKAGNFIVGADFFLFATEPDIQLRLRAS